MFQPRRQWNFQNFYERFRSSSVFDGVEEDESTGFDSIDVDENVVDLSYLDEELVSGNFQFDVMFLLAMDLFVVNIIEFGNCPFSLSVASGVKYLRNEDCTLAMRNLKAVSFAGSFMFSSRRAELICSTDFNSVPPHALNNKEKHSVVFPLMILRKYITAL